MRVVLDTNVLISALIKSGKPQHLLKLLLGPDHALILSEPIIEEFSRVTADEKIERYADDEAVTMFLEVLLSRAVFVRLRSRVQVFDNPDDDVLNTAKEGDADFIVTGDKHMLELKEFGRTKIVTVKKALSIMERKR
ncbi:MAG: putative toxin-antitoxin system toxin component, PIN family [Nitrososphaerales archaeon]|nr:putative toxin-antitoxin system toxin component, PIN family [Nitrososphaerales archaeon]